MASIPTVATVGSGADTVSRVAALAPRFRERAVRTESERSIPLESIDELVAAGMARMLVPREFGGDDLTQRTMVLATMEAARGCPSTGWCASLLAHVPHQAAYFPEEAQRSIWANGPDARIAGSTRPTARVDVVPGGYRLTGRHGFASGVDHADWVFVGGIVPGDGIPDWRFFLLERGQYQIDDTWHTAGMRGTGSKTIVVDDVFVPQAHTMRQSDCREGTAPGCLVNADPKYRLPWNAFSGLGFSATAVGAVRGAYEDFRTAAATKRDVTGSPVAQSQHLQIAVGEAAARLDAAETLLLRLADRADSKTEWTLADRAQVMGSSRLAASLALEVMDAIVSLAGTSAFDAASPVQRAWRDVHFVAAHVALSVVETFGRAGRHELGVAEESGFGFY